MEGGGDDDKRRGGGSERKKRYPEDDDDERRDKHREKDKKEGGKRYREDEDVNNMRCKKHRKTRRTTTVDWDDDEEYLKLREQKNEMGERGSGAQVERKKQCRKEDDYNNMNNKRTRRTKNQDLDDDDEDLTLIQNEFGSNKRPQLYKDDRLTSSSRRCYEDHDDALMRKPYHDYYNTRKSHNHHQRKQISHESGGDGQKEREAGKDMKPYDANEGKLTKQSHKSHHERRETRESSIGSSKFQTNRSQDKNKTHDGRRSRKGWYRRDDVTSSRPSDDGRINDRYSSEYEENDGKVLHDRKEKVGVDQSVQAQKLSEAEESQGEDATRGKERSIAQGKLKDGDHAHISNPETSRGTDLSYKSSKVAIEEDPAVNSESPTLTDIEYSTKYDSRVHRKLRVSSDYALLKMEGHEEKEHQPKEMNNCPSASSSYYSYTGGGKYQSLMSRFSSK